jgi:membrane protein DedA with SNARE-associated domain
MWATIHHYLVFTVVLMLTGMGLPIPEEVPIVAAGVASSLGALNPWAAFVACLVGALLGDSILYGIGYHFGHNLIRRHPRLAQMLHAEREAQIERMIRKHGLKVFFVARFMVGVRAPMYLAAGVLRMKYRYFLLVDLFCATCVVGLFFGLSYRYGEPIRGAIRGYEVAFTVVVCVLIAALSLFMWLRSRRVNLDAANGNGSCEGPSDQDGHADHVADDSKTIAHK